MKRNNKPTQELLKKLFGKRLQSIMALYVTVTYFVTGNLSCPAGHTPAFPLHKLHSATSDFCCFLNSIFLLLLKVFFLGFTFSSLTSSWTFRCFCSCSDVGKRREHSKQGHVSCSSTISGSSAVKLCFSAYETL